MGFAASLPQSVRDVFGAFRVCEMSTLAKDGTPVTWPVATLLGDDGRFLLTTSIAMPYKAFNVRRNPRVSLLFSDPTASGLTNPPTVLVQGDATAPDRIVTAHSELRDYWRDRIMSRQPSGRLYSMNGLTRRLFDWYYMRLVIYVTPKRVLWWPNGDQTQTPQVVGGEYVA